MMPDSTGPRFNGVKIPFCASLTLAVLFTFAIAGCAPNSSQYARPKYAPAYKTYETLAAENNRSKVNSILKTAFSQFGNPYRYGGNSPETGFDCSGFVSWVYKQYGVNLPRSSRDMLSVGTPIAKSDLRPGDLVFFNYGYSHVGIYTGNNKYIHSPSTGKRIQESDLNGKGRREHYIGARRVIDNQGVTNISENLKAEWVKQSRHRTDLALSDRAATRVTGARANYGRPKASASKKNKNGRGASASRKSASSAKTAKVHKVSNGDTMYDLARRYGVSTSDLVSYNRISNAKSLKPGQTIKIPEKASGASKAKSSAKGKSKSSAKGKTASAKGAKAKSGKAKSSKAKSGSGKAKPKTSAKKPVLPVKR